MDLTLCSYRFLFVSPSIFLFFFLPKCSECSGSVVECLSRDRRAAGSSLTSVTVLWPWARHIYPSLVLVQPRKTRPYITERLLIDVKNKIKQKISQNVTFSNTVWCSIYPYYRSKLFSEVISRRHTLLIAGKEFNCLLDEGSAMVWLNGNHFSPWSDCSLGTVWFGYTLLSHLRGHLLKFLSFMNIHERLHPLWVII